MSSPADQLANTTRAKVHRLQGPYLSGTPTAVRTLAVLRRQASASALDPEVWDEFFDRVPDQLIGRGDEPSDAERALQAALVLYAIHQQSRGTAMHQSGATLGQAVRRLSNGATEAATVRRFKALGSSSTWEEVLHHLRGLVTQLRGQGITLDYGLLARDLLFLQEPATAAGVRRRWGRDLHRAAPDERTENLDSTTGPASGTNPTDPTGEPA